MTTREIVVTAFLGSLLYIIYTLGSFILYVELFNFIILLYGFYLNRKQAWLAVMLFSFLLILTKGLSLWSIMYVVVFPQYVLIYSFLKNKLTSEYSIAAVGFFFAFICGTLIDIPYILMTQLDYQALIIRFLMGFQVSLGNAVCTFIACLYFLKPLSRVLVKYGELTSR